MSSDSPSLPKDITDAFNLKLISQGAEAQIFFSRAHPYIPSDLPAGVITISPSRHGHILKFRPPKKYRHAILDAQLTKHRTLSEARVLYKLSLAGVNVPRLIAVDPRQGIIWMQNINGRSLKQYIWDVEAGLDENAEQVAKKNQWAGAFESKLQSVGAEIAKLHYIDIVHGDLTTSNIMLKEDHENDNDVLPVIIDFGLAQQSTLPEDKAVDLYVLERAVISTHPKHSEEFTTWLLEGYLSEFNSQKGGSFKAKEILKKLDAVRLRGRKRSMVG
ncbi:kinase-like domain-containing protein [Lipomyces japonicus]|uniref:kinase-like domain-containing protein n=1 Tax=Lipomyces japonicus TaxID=56871 RepID=UPI0034D01912